MRLLRHAAIVVLAVVVGGVVPSMSKAASGPSGVSYEIATVCATGSMTVRADATGLTGSGSVAFMVTPNATGSGSTVTRGARTSVTVRGMVAPTDGVTVTEGSTTVASAQYGQSCVETPYLDWGLSYFVPLTPTRVLDTRPDHLIGYSAAKPVAGGTVELQLAGIAGVASNATAVVLNLTATQPDGPGYVQAFPKGRGTPGTSSNVNIERAGQTIPNAAIVRLGDGGGIELYSTTATHLIADVSGYFVPATEYSSLGFTAVAGRLKGVGPTRVFDTRPATAVEYSGPKPGAGSTVEVAVYPTALQPDVPIPSNMPQPSTIGSVVLNVTATESTGPGFVQVAPGGSLVPGASSSLNLNGANETIPNLVIVPVSASGTVSIYTSGGTHLAVDVLGYFTNDTAPNSKSGLFVPLDPERVLDSRPESRLDGGAFDGAAGTSTNVNFDGLPDVSGSVVLSVVATQTGAPGFVQVGPDTLPDGMTPGAHSNLNVERADQTIPNMVITQSNQLGIDGVTFYTSSRAQIVADIFGWFTYSNVG